MCSLYEAFRRVTEHSRALELYMQRDFSYNAFEETERLISSINMPFICGYFCFCFKY